MISKTTSGKEKERKKRKCYSYMAHKVLDANEFKSKQSIILTN